MSDETNLIDDFLRARLLADSALSTAAGGRVYDDPPAPENAAYPYVQMQWLGSVDAHCLPERRVGVEAIYLVEGVNQGRTFKGALKTLADRIDAVLQGLAVAPVVSAGRTWHLWREGPFRQATLENGVHYRRLGGRWRIWTDPAA